MCCALQYITSTQHPCINLIERGTPAFLTVLKIIPCRFLNTALYCYTLILPKPCSCRIFWPLMFVTHLDSVLMAVFFSMGDPLSQMDQIRSRPSLCCQVWVLGDDLVFSSLQPGLCFNVLLSIFLWGGNWGLAWNTYPTHTHLTLSQN